MAETYLWMTSQTNIFGISLVKLLELGEEEVVDLVESISTPPFDFHLKLPEEDMRPFVFDSKLFLGGDYLYSDPDVLSYKFSQLLFEDVDDDNNNKLRISEAALDSIPPPPTHVAYSFIANIAGEVYLLVYDDEWTKIPRDEGLWVLRSGEWQPLQDPPTLHEDGFSGSSRFFVHQEKLFLEASDSQSHLYVFDPQTDTWTEVEDNIKNSFALWDHRYLNLPSIAVSLPDVCNCTVTLFWTTEGKSPRPYEKIVSSLKIYAMLLNNQDNSVYCYQSLDECSDAIKPTSFDVSSVVFVDLGNGLVCALVTGHVREYDRSTLLCVLVFALSLAQEFGTDAPGKEKRFLNVDRVLVNRVFSMQDYEEGYSREEMQHAIIFPPMEELLPPQKMPSYSKGRYRLHLKPSRVLKEPGFVSR